MCCSYIVLANPNIKLRIQFIIMKIFMKIVKICPKSPRFTVPCSSNFQKGKRSPRMRCDVLCSHTIALFGNDAFIHSQNVQKVENDIVLFNGYVLGHAWHTWYKKGTSGKKMSCSLLICHMHIFKSIDFRTMGLWKWITIFCWYALYREKGVGYMYRLSQKKLQSAFGYRLRKYPFMKS